MAVEMALGNSKLTFCTLLSVLLVLTAASTSPPAQYSSNTPSTSPSWVKGVNGLT